MRVEPYLNFDGRCEEAIEFYRSALGAEVTMLMRFKDSPEKHAPGMSPAAAEKIMHSSLRIGDSVIMASDGCCAGKADFQGISLSIAVSSATEAEKAFAALSVGGKVRMPLTKTFYSPAFGMLADRFGVTWMIMAS